MVEKYFAGAVLAVCAVLLVRLLLGERRRQRFDAAVARRWRVSRSALRSVWHWRGAHRRAAREADEAIRRARRGVRREGNVIHPDSFETPRKPH